MNLADLFAKLTDLSARLKAKDFGGALGVLLQLCDALYHDWNNIPPTPANTLVAAAPGAGATNQSDQVATQLDQFVQRHQTTQAGGVTAIPWGTLLPQLLPLLLQVFQAIFARQ